MARKRGYAPIKILWMMNGLILKIGYSQNQKEAEEEISKSYNRKWGTAIILYRSEKLGRYVTVPES